MHNEQATFSSVRSDPYAIACIEQADLYISKIGYTEHGLRHAELSASIAKNILLRLGYDARLVELAEVAGYLHDIGNVIARDTHVGAGALLSKDIMDRHGFSPAEIALVMNAIGNHEEDTGWPTSEVGAALILADKSDVHRTRVRSKDNVALDIHDRVNFAAKRSFLRVTPEDRTITLEIEIDNEISKVMEYFEIFLSRMVMCRRAAEYIDTTFHLTINGSKLL